MLMQFDPFREFDRLAEQLAAGAPTSGDDALSTTRATR